MIILICFLLAALAPRSLSEESQVALFPIHPNSEAFQMEQAEDFDHTIQGFRRIQQPGGREIFVSDKSYFQFSAITAVKLIVAAGMKSVSVEFSTERMEDLRKLRLNQLTDRFALLNSRRELIGIVSTVSVGVETRRLSIPVFDMKEAERLMTMLNSKVSTPESKPE